MIDTLLCQNRYSNDPGAGGRTLERMLGVVPNNSKSPDLDDEHELKTHKTGSVFPTTLFAQEPKFGTEFLESSGLKKRGPVSQMTRIIGQRLSFPLVYHQETTCVQNKGFQSLCANSERKGFRLYICEMANTLRLIWDRSVAAIYDSVWADSVPQVLDGLTLEWDLDELNRRALLKLDSVKLVPYASDENYVKYGDFYQEMKGLKRFSDCIRTGVVIVEINSSIKPNGRVHNHGCKFRCDPNNLKRLYAQAPTISSTKDLINNYGPNYCLAV